MPETIGDNTRPFDVVDAMVATRDPDAMLALSASVSDEEFDRAVMRVALEIRAYFDKLRATFPVFEGLTNDEIADLAEWMGL